jgi:transcriptional regulator with XRE-family HTH domain
MSLDEKIVAIGQRIREVRGRLTQAEFATRLGVDRKTVTRWEAGERMPDGASLLALLSEFDADIQEILTGERHSDRARASSNGGVDWQLLEQLIAGVEEFLGER